jgi:hypothetical protein
MFNQGVDAAAARPLTQRFAKLGEGIGVARRDNFNMTVLGVAHPAMQVQRGCLAVDKPPEANSLHTAFDQVMPDHNSSTVMRS